METDFQWLKQIKSVHVIGASKKSDKPSNRLFLDMKDSGWRLIPINPQSVGDTIYGLPFRSFPQDEQPELFVVFLSPDSTLEFLKKWMYMHSSKPHIWLQPGAENSDVIHWLKQANWPFTSSICWVETTLEQDLTCEYSHGYLPWYIQYKDETSHCSIWKVIELESSIQVIDKETVEWVGDLVDLEIDTHQIPQYIRTLQKAEETLEETAKRLS